MRDPWLQTITRPVSHLVVTCLVFAVLIACVVLSVIIPEWMGVFGIVGAAPVVAWYLFMMKAYKQNRARWLASVTPTEP